MTFSKFMKLHQKIRICKVQKNTSPMLSQIPFPKTPTLRQNQCLKSKQESLKLSLLGIVNKSQVRQLGLILLLALVNMTHMKVTQEKSNKCFKRISHIPTKVLSTLGIVSVLMYQQSNKHLARRIMHHPIIKFQHPKRWVVSQEVFHSKPRYLNLTTQLLFNNNLDLVIKLNNKTLSGPVRLNNKVTNKLQVWDNKFKIAKIATVTILLQKSTHMYYNRLNICS